jgi:hypothetical protein
MDGGNRMKNMFALKQSAIHFAQQHVVQLSEFAVLVITEGQQ